MKSELSPAMKKLRQYIDKQFFIDRVNTLLKDDSSLLIDSFVSNICNLNCKHCYFGDTQPHSEAVSLSRWISFIEEALKIRFHHFHFSGKEPFLDKRLHEIFAFLDEKKQIYPQLFYGAVSNGTSLNADQYNSVLATNISYLEFSIEGLNKYNDSVRGDGVFSVVINTIKALNEKYKINITSTVFEDNHQDLISVVDFLRKIGIRKFNFAPIVSFSSNNIEPVYSLPSRTILKFIDKCFDYIENIREPDPLNIRICLTKQIAYDLFCQRTRLSSKINEYIYNGDEIRFQMDNKVVEISFPLLYIPFFSELVITHDGYIIPCADDIHYKNISEICLPQVNIKKNNIEEILQIRAEYINQYLNDNL